MDILRHAFFVPKCHIEYFLKNIRTNLGFPLFYHQQTKFREANIFTGICLSWGGVRYITCIMGWSHGRLPPLPSPDTRPRDYPSSPDTRSGDLTPDIRPGDLPPPPTSTDIQWLPPKHVRLASGRYTSY